MDKIILASRNPDKIRELRESLAGMDIELKSALEYPELEEVVEDRATLKGNAMKKALYVHRAAGLPALADDTGLEVDALNGMPGVYSARYAGEDASYLDNLGKLLADLEGVPMKKRNAQFRTVVAFVSEEGSRHTFEGAVKGVIVEEPRGEGGFGYDPVFLPEGFDKTFAELDAEVKNRISHRSRAIHKFHEWLSKQP